MDDQVAFTETPEALATLLENHRAFLRFLERKVGDRALAEDILQDAFVKMMDRPEAAPADEGLVPWFMGKANCTQCHNGPLFTNNEFHNTGVPAVKALPTDRGRFEGMASVLKDEFNCRSQWSDASPAACSELEFTPQPSHEQERAFKVPSLRNVAERAPYMHAGQLATLGDTLNHYNAAPAAPAGHTELKPLNLNERELAQLEAFLGTLSGGTVERVRPVTTGSRRD